MGAANAMFALLISRFDGLRCDLYRMIVFSEDPECGPLRPSVIVGLESTWALGRTLVERLYRIEQPVYCWEVA